MNRPFFDLPFEDLLSGKVSLTKPFLPGTAGLRLGAGDLESDFEREEFQALEGLMHLWVLLMSQAEKIRVFLEAMKDPQNSRWRKDITRELARATRRSEKEIHALSDPEKASLYARHAHRIDHRIASVVIGSAMTSRYFGTADRLLQQVAAAPENAAQLTNQVQNEIPEALWALVLMLIRNDRDKPPKILEACKLVDQSLSLTVRSPRLPFTVWTTPRLTALEQHLLELHRQDPAKAKPLISSLTELNPSRPENWFLLGLTDCQDPAPRQCPERAWWLAGALYRWGDNLQTVDTPFDAEKLRQNADAIRLLFAAAPFAPARELIGEFLIRQLAEASEMGLLIEVLPPDLERQNGTLLQPLIQIHAKAQAALKQVAEVRALVQRFPFLKTTGVLALALRRDGDFAGAAAELRESNSTSQVERALIEARLADALALELPEDAPQQQQLAQRLKPFQEFLDEEHPEVVFCNALATLLSHDREMAGFDFDKLEKISIDASKRAAYRLLLALQAQDDELITEAIAGLGNSQAEEILAFIPTNLLASAIRALALIPEPQPIQSLAALLYQYLPEALDPLLANEELLAASPALLQRLLDKNQAVADPIQRWAGYQRVLSLASAYQSHDLIAQAIDGCLAINDPLLAPHQVRLLRERIPSCEDLDLRELLAERLAELSPEETKPFLYQLLQAYMGNQRAQDASRILQTLHDLGENSVELEQCARALQSAGQPAVQGTTAPKNDRLPRPVSVGFFGGDTNHKARTDQLRAELIRKHPGLNLEFDHTVWNPKNLASLVQSVAKFEVIVASNLMRTDISRAIRQRARELNKTWGYCRNQGLATITNSILNTISLHFNRKG